MLRWIIAVVLLLQVLPEVTPGLSARSHAFWYDDPSVSNDLLVTLLFHLPPADRGLDASVAASGTRYWTFPPDDPDRMPELRRAIRARVAAASAARP